MILFFIKYSIVNLLYLQQKKSIYIYRMKKTRILAVNHLIYTLKILEIEVGKSDLSIEVDETTNGDRALEKIEKGEQYDAILMNLEMPIMSGWEATEKIRELGVTTPIIAWSLHFKELKMKECLEVGMNDYIEIDSFNVLKSILEALERVGVKVLENHKILS